MVVTVLIPSDFYIMMYILVHSMISFFLAFAICSGILHCVLDHYAPAPGLQHASY